MKTRTTLILLGVFAAILAYWLFFERHAKTPLEAARDAKKVFQADDQEVRAITLERPNQPRVRLERSGEKWRMLEPVAARAERWSADAAAEALLAMEQTRTIPNDRGERGLAEMGFTPARAKVTFTLGPKTPAKEKDAGPGGARGASGSTGTGDAAGSPGASGSAAGSSAAPGAAAPAPAGPVRVLEIGGSVPTTESVFVRAGGREEIGIVSSSAVTALLRTPDELRDHSLLDTTALAVFDARIERKGSEGLRFRRREGEWWMEQPLPDAAEGSVVQGLLTTLIGLRADTFEDAASAAGLDPPDATIHLAAEKGVPIAEVAFGTEIAGESARRHVRVTSPGEPPVYALVPAPDLSAMMGPPVSFRARHALSFRSWDANAVTLASPAAALSFIRKEGVWTAVSPAGLKVSQEAVDAMLQEISDLSIVGFDAAAGKSPAEMGLEPAKTKVEIKIGEPSSRTLTLALGAPAGGPNVLYASTPGRPVFTVGSAILERVQSPPSLYEEKPPPPATTTPTTPGASGTSPAPPKTSAASGPAGSGD
jgi:hypothetical protein